MSTHTCPINETAVPLLQTHALSQYHIGIDIGGTNTRVTLVTADTDIRHFISIATFKSTRTTILKESLNNISGQLQVILKNQPLGTCLAIAGPIDDRCVAVLTNYEKDDCFIEVKDLAEFAFPKDRTFFVNDLEGTCAGILALNQNGLLGEYYTPLWNPVREEPGILSNKSCLVLAMGTGLGTALILTDFSRKSHHIFPMEGGHILINEVGSNNGGFKKEKDVIEAIGKELYGNSTSIEYEDICSGRGVGYVYKSLTGEDLGTGEVINKAKNKDQLALEAVNFVYRFLIRNAQTLCVLSQAKSVYLSGDNQVTNLEFVVALKDTLHEDFLNHPKRAWLEVVDVWTQNQSANFNVFGALFLARKYHPK